MGENLGIARFTFHEGGFEEIERLSAQAMEIVRGRDTGTLQYDIYHDEDRSERIVIGRYRDSDALIEHGAHLAAISAAVLETDSVAGRVLGEPNDELRKRLAASPTRLFTPLLSTWTLGG